MIPYIKNNMGLCVPVSKSTIFKFCGYPTCQHAKRLALTLPNCKFHNKKKKKKTQKDLKIILFIYLPNKCFLMAEMNLNVCFSKYPF